MTERTRPAPADRFDAAVNEFDLMDQLAILRNEETPARHGHRQKTLFKHGGRTVALFSLEPGGGLHEHAAQGLVTIHCVEGRISVWASGLRRELQTGGLLVLTPNERHGVEGLTRSAFLLTVCLDGQ
jgi:quercetin dioxygenase-like cupin family protein